MSDQTTNPGRPETPVEDLGATRPTSETVSAVSRGRSDARAAFGADRWTAADLVPPIPVSCIDRPTVGGLVAPFVNIRLADGGVDFRTPHQATYQKCWTDGLCQTCGQKITGRAVLFGGPNQLAKRHFDEPPTCTPCAVYASRACLMVSGRMPHYADRQRLAEGRRGHVCPDEGCGCGGFTAANPDAHDASGEPAHAWYAVYVRAGTWQLTGQQVRVPCSDRGCLHDRLLVNGARLTAEPLKVVVVSEPGAGRVWRTLPADAAAALTHTEGADHAG